MGTALNNQQEHHSPTHCAFIDFETCYPSMHRDRLSLILHRVGVRGKLWRLLTESYREIRVRVLHPLIPDTQTEEILRGSKLRPILFSIFLAELIEHLQTKFPFATTQGKNGQVWIGALAFVDDLV